jgi:hypothetical protein
LLGVGRRSRAVLTMAGRCPAGLVLASRLMSCHVCASCSCCPACLHTSRGLLSCDAAIAGASSSHVLLSKLSYRLPYLCSLQRQNMTGDATCLTTGARIRSLARAMTRLLRAQLAEGRKVQEIQLVSPGAWHAGLRVVNGAFHQPELVGGDHRCCPLRTSSLRVLQALAAAPLAGPTWAGHAGRTSAAYLATGYTRHIDSARPWHSPAAVPAACCLLPAACSTRCTQGLDEGISATLMHS